MNSVIGTGKTMDQAIENALLELNATQDQVTIKVLSEGGLFKKAKVEVTLDEKEKEEPIVSFDEDEVVEVKPVNKKGKKQVVVDVDVKVDPKVKVKEPKVDVTVNEQDGSTNVKVKKTKVDAKVNVETNVKVKNAESKKANSGIDDKTAEKVLSETILSLLKFSKGENIEIGFTFDDRTVFVSVKGEKLGGVIGSNGDTLNAIESFVNVVASKNGINKRVRIDIGGYKEERVNKLVKLAEKAYQIAVKNGKYKFDPMPARDRRIIHTALQNKEDVTTFSKGTEPKRFVIIEKK